MSIVLLPVIEAYRTLLTPIAPFTWFGLPFTSLDIIGATRLCILLRQFKEKLHYDHVQKLQALRAQGVAVNAQDEIEERSFVRDAMATLTVVFGGEMITGTSSRLYVLLGIPPMNECIGGISFCAIV